MNENEKKDYCDIATRVLDNQGAPLPNCKVTIMLDYDTETMTKPPSSIFPKLSNFVSQTDNDGYANFHQLEISSYAWGNYTLTILAIYT